MSYLFRWMLAACLALSPVPAFAADTVALTKRLHNAADISSLDDPSLKPWHLKLNVQLYDAKGKPSEQGTIEEWWTPQKYKRIYNTPSYKATEIRDGKSVYRTKGQPTVPYFLHAALAFVVHPIVQTEIIDRSDLESQTQSFGKVQLDCILLTKPGNRSGPLTVGRVPTFCLEPGLDLLRVYWLDPEVCTRNQVGLFQGRQVGISCDLSISGVKTISEHVEILESKTFDESIFTPGSDVEDRSSDPFWLSAGTAQLKLLKSEPPIFPMIAKSKHVSGTVMLLATIGEDGHVIDTEVLASPESSLSQSAIQSVSHWVYTPFVLNGIAVKVKTKVMVRYNFGSR